jgi:hypothetical protein
MKHVLYICFKLQLNIKVSTNEIIIHIFVKKWSVCKIPKYLTHKLNNEIKLETIYIVTC